MTYSGDAHLVLKTKVQVLGRFSLSKQGSYGHIQGKSTKS
jgi:hypothetical protein